MNRIMRLSKRESESTMPKSKFDSMPNGSKWCWVVTKIKEIGKESDNALHFRIWHWRTISNWLPRRLFINICRARLNHTIWNLNSEKDTKEWSAFKHLSATGFKIERTSLPCLKLSSIKSASWWCSTTRIKERKNRRSNLHWRASKPWNITRNSSTIFWAFTTDTKSPHKTCLTPSTTMQQ